MPTTLSSFATSEFRMRYKEEFLTDGLNAKLAVNTPPGTYRGFKLATNGSALTVTIQSDVSAADHVAVYQTAGGRSLTIRKTGGDFALSLAGFTSKTVVIALFAVEVLGTPTSAEIRAYEFSPSDTFTGAAEVGELVVLGTVVVPAGGVIPAANITHDRRTPAWAAEAADAVAWAPVIRNPSFEYGVTGGLNKLSISDWQNTSQINGRLRLSVSNVRTGAKCLEFDKNVGGAATCKLEQLLELPVVPGQIVRVSGWIRQLIAPTGGSYQFNLNWGDLDSGTPTTTTITASAAGTDGAYRKVEGTVTVPTSKFVLKSVSIDVVAVTTGSTGTAAVFDDFQVYVESGSPLALASTANLRLQQQLVTSLVIEDATTYSINQLAGLFRFDRTTPASEGKLVLDRKDMDAAALPPALEILGRMVGLGGRLVGSAANARLPRIGAVYSGTHAFTLLWETPRDSGSGPGVRLYVSSAGELTYTVNAVYGGATWTKDVNGTAAQMAVYRAGGFDFLHRPADQDAAWATFSSQATFTGARTTTAGTPNFVPTVQLFDAAGNRRVAFDHLALPKLQSVTGMHQSWMPPDDAAWFSSNVATGTSLVVVSGVAGRTGPWLEQTVAANADRTTKYSFRTVKEIAADTLYVADWSLDPTNLVGTPALVYQAGLAHDEGLEPSSENQIKFFKSSASANWQFVVRNPAGGPTTVNTGIVPTAGVQRFRLEVYGANWPGGARALGYINGVLAAEVTTNLPNTSQLSALIFYLKSTGALNQKVWVSPVSIWQSWRAAADDPI